MGYPYFKASNKQTVIKSSLYFALAIWAIFVLTSYLNTFQHLPASKDSVVFGQFILFIVGIYSFCWIIVSRFMKHSLMSDLSSQYFSGFPLVLALAAVTYLGILFRATYLENSVHFYLADAIKGFAFLGLFLCASFLLGDVLLGKLSNGLRTIDRLFIDVSLGFGVLAIITFMLGVAGLLYVVPARIIIIALGLLGFVKLVLLTRTQLLKKMLVIPHPFAVMLGIIVVLSFAAAMLPPWNYDSMLYHLAIPKLYLISHRIYYVKDFLPANYPLNGEMLFLMALLIKNDVLAQLVSHAIGCWLVLGEYVFAAKFFSRRSGALAVALMLSIPAFMRQLPVNNNDTLLALFALSGIYALVSWSQGETKKWLFLSGFLLGCGAGSKYSGFFLLPASIAVVAFALLAKKYCVIGQRQPMISQHDSLKNTAFLELIGFTLFCLVGVAPWLLKNFLFTGNPVYPVFANILGGRDWASSSTTIFTQTVRNANLLSHGFTGYVTLPWHLTFRLPSETTIGPALLSLIPTLLVVFVVSLKTQMRRIKLTVSGANMRIAEKSPIPDIGNAEFTSLWPVLIPLTMGSFYLLIWATTLAQVARFALPGIAISIPVLAAAIDILFKISSSRKEPVRSLKERFSVLTLRAIVAIILIISIFTGLYLLAIDNFDAMRIAASPQLCKQFTSNSGLYQASAFVNHHIRKNRRMAMLIDNRAYYLNCDNTLMLNPLNNGRIDQLNISTPDQLLSILARENIEYVFATDEVRRYVYALPKGSPYRIYYPLVRNCDRLIDIGALRPVFKSGDFWIYKVNK